MTQPEKRAEKRIPYEHTVVFRSETTIMEVALDISNISMSGVYVLTKHPLDLGTKCSLEIKLYSDGQPVVLLIEGLVSRVDDKGQGVEFTDIGEENSAKLQEVLSLTA